MSTDDMFAVFFLIICTVLICVFGLDGLGKSIDQDNGDYKKHYLNSVK